MLRELWHNSGRNRQAGRQAGRLSCAVLRATKAVLLHCRSDRIVKQYEFMTAELVELLLLLLLLLVCLSCCLIGCVLVVLRQYCVCVCERERERESV